MHATYTLTHIHTAQTLDIQGNPLYPSWELPAAAIACWTGVYIHTYMHAYYTDTRHTRKPALSFRGAFSDAGLVYTYIHTYIHTYYTDT